MEDKEKYDWGKEFDAIESCLSNYFFVSSIDFFEKHLNLIPIYLSEKDKSFRDYLSELWAVLVKFYLVRESHKDLDPAVEVKKKPDGSWNLHGSMEATNNFIKSLKLNSEEEKDLRKLISEKFVLVAKCFKEMTKARWALYHYGGSNKPFWMEANFRKFISAIRDGMEKKVDADAKFDEDMRRVSGNINDVELKEINEGKRVKKAHIGEVLADFEKILRGVQRNVLEHWESAKHWWEKWWVVVPLAVGGGLSVFAANITICEWLSKSQWFVHWFSGCGVSDWGIWFLPSVGGLLAAGYFGYLIYKRIKNKRL